VLPDNPDPQRLLEAVDAANRWIAASRGRHTFIGGFAVTFLGDARVTQDIDAVVVLNEEHLDEFLSLGEQYGFAGRESGTLEFALQYRVLKLVHLPSGVRFDLSLAGTDFELQAIDNAAMFEVSGVSFPLPRPSDLVVMKAFAGRPRDVRDIEGLLDRNPDIELPVVRAWLVGLASLLDDDRAVRDFDEMVRRRERRPPDNP
jgi:hypothetical protein